MLTIARVLLAGGEAAELAALREALESAGHEVIHAPSLDESTRRLAAGEADVVVLTPGLEQSLPQLSVVPCPESAAAVVVLTRRMSAAVVHDALRGGASDVVDASGGEHALVASVERVARDRQLRRELAMLRARVGDAAAHALIGRSAGMARVREVIGRAAGSRVPVLVTGEAGTGKDVAARLVHDLSDRATRPYAVVRCGVGDQESLERELFGTMGGNGSRARAGLLEQARGGTVVLEDAQLLSPSLRTQLGRVGLTRATQRVGGAESLAADVRLVLVVRTTAGAESDAVVEDLLSRFNAILIDVPPLRERRSDIPQLVQHFRARLAAEQGIDLPPLSPDEMLPLLGHEWSGNVRELEHWVERSALSARAGQSRAGGSLAGIDLGAARATLEELERAYILHVLELEGGHQSKTAIRLGIDRRTLYRKLKQYRSGRATQQQATASQA